MTEDTTTPPDDGGDNGPLAGERLAEARRARELSTLEIANSLHLDEYKVQALEQNEFEKLGAPVFAKGYLRKYAALVGVPVDDILADYYRLNRSSGTPLVIPTRLSQPRNIIPTRVRLARNISLGPWVGGFVVVIVVAGAAWWWLSGATEWFGNSTEPAALAPFDDDPGVVSPPNQGAPAAEPEAEPVGDDAAGQPDSAEAPAQQSTDVQSVAEQPRAGGPSQVELRLTFTGDCWTEVTDASGERLYFGLGSDGRAVTVSGEPPLQILLGNSANATLAVNGSSYPIPQSARRGDTARLTITDL
jgi:cytoskeleton protein RodZ